MALIATGASPLQALLTEIVPEEQRGSLMSLSMAAGQLGFGAGGAIAGPA
jgi:MFS family permease